jgi:hypothetical protein
MALIKGLASIKNNQEEQKAKAAASGKKFPDMFYKVFPKRGDEIVVRFLQELDPEMANYREDRGVGFIAVEHEAGDSDRAFMFKALCTMDSENQCYGCERHKANYKEGWRPKQNLYINVLTEIDGELKVFVIAKNANSGFVQSLIQEAIDEGSITDANYRITKTGEKSQTQWLLKRLKSEPLDDSESILWNLEEEVVKDISYADQAEFYGKAFGANQKPAEPDETRPSVATSSGDDEW